MPAQVPVEDARRARQILPRWVANDTKGHAGMYPPYNNIHELFHTDPPDPTDPRWRAARETTYDDWSDGQPAEERLRHVILVDGRLVDTWAEPVEGSHWEHHARRADQRRTCQHVPPVPTPHPYDEVLDWLDGLVGGRRALEALTPIPLSMATLPPDLGEGPPTCLVSVRELLDRTATELFDAEVRAALHHALNLLWTENQDLVRHRKVPAQIAGGLCWVVGRANGLFGPDNPVAQKDVQRHLCLTTPISGVGATVQRALRRLGPEPPRRPVGCPDLVALGEPGLLTSATRLQLVDWRDRSLAARDAHLADVRAARANDDVQPPEIES